MEMICSYPSLHAKWLASGTDDTYNDDDDASGDYGYSGDCGGDDKDDDDDDDDDGGNCCYDDDDDDADDDEEEEEDGDDDRGGDGGGGFCLNGGDFDNVDYNDNAVGHGGSLVDSSPFARRVVGSNPA